MKIITLICVVALTFSAGAQNSWSARELGPGEFTYEAKIHVFRVLTNITGNGLTSQTLSGVAGSFQVVNEKWDDVELVMDGETLTWDGEEFPEHPRIIRLASPQVLSENTEGVSVHVHDQSEVQYFEHKEGDLFILRTLNVSKKDGKRILGDIPVLGELFRESDNSALQWVNFGPGIHIRIAPKPLEETGVWEADFTFQSLWIKSRESLEGVNLNVGKPELDGVGVFGKLGIRDGEWVCYRTPTSSRGYIYMFLKIEIKPPTEEDTSSAPKK
jgi:hypothetical protein